MKTIPNALVALRPPSIAPADAGRFYRYRGFFLLILLALVLWLNLSFLVPLTMGAIFATVLFPMMTWLSRFRLLGKGKNRRASIVTLIFILGFLIPISVIVALGANAAVDKLKSLEDTNFSVNQLTTNPNGVIDAFGLRPLLDRIVDITPFTQQELIQYSTRTLVAMGALAGKALQVFIASLPGVMFANVVMLFTIFFLLSDGPRAVAFVRENSVFGRKQTDRILIVAKNLCFSVMVATLASGAVQAALIGIACVITGAGSIALIVFVSFLASFVPMVGNAPITVGLALFAFIEGRTTDGIIFLVFIFLVGLSDNFVRPLVLKGKAELHPLIGFVAAFGALNMIGFYGLFIGPVIAGLFFTLLPMVTRSYPKSQRST